MFRFLPCKTLYGTNNSHKRIFGTWAYLDRFSPLQNCHPVSNIADTLHMAFYTGRSTRCIRYSFISIRDVKNQNFMTDLWLANLLKHFILKRLVVYTWHPYIIDNMLFILPLTKPLYTIHFKYLYLQHIKIVVYVLWVHCQVIYITCFCVHNDFRKLLCFLKMVKE